jgi:hypothetical protein
MTTVAYGTFVKDLKDKLVDKIKTTSSFASSTFADYIKDISTNPTAFVRPLRDEIIAIGPQETRHRVTFRVEVEFRGSYEEATMDSLMGYIGEIVDAIEADRDLGSTYIRNTEVTLIDYMARRSRSAVFHFVHVNVRMEALRNV